MEKNKSLAMILKENEGRIKQIGGKQVNARRLIALAIEATKNTALRNVSASSVIDFCIKCAEAGTDRIGAGGMWAVPFKDTKTSVVRLTAIPDWRLIIEKARRSGVINYAYAEVVRKKDVFDYERGLNPNLIHKPAKGDRGEITHAYCVYVLPDGTRDFEIMDKKEIDAIKTRSKAKTGPWETDYQEMAKKTVVKRALKKFEGASPELSKIIDIDNQAVGYEIQEEEPIAEPQEIQDAEVIEQPSAEEKKEPVKEQEPTKCENCGIEIKPAVAKYSQSKYGKRLCIDCQGKERTNE